MASIVYEGVKNTTGDGGKLFDGKSFWFSSAVPQRKWLIDNAIANGATIVPLEKQADILIVDHARKNAPVGTHSYKYIEQSIRNGTLEDLADHIVGPTKSTDRPVGSMITAPKGSRSKYTEAEDQLLWNFIKPYELGGGATGGNEIYKQLEEAHGNGRHTYQSWRDRWLKHVKFQNRQITGSAYTAEVGEEEGTEATRQVAQASPRRRGPVAATPPPSSPRRAVAVTNGQASLDSPNRSRTVPASPEDAATFHYRQALERKLGRILPSVPSSSNFQNWEQVPVLKRLEDVARTEVFQLRRQQAGWGTHIVTEQGVLEEQSVEPSQTGAEEPDIEDVSVESTKGSDEYFTDEDYKFLMDAAAHMIRVGDQDDDSWGKMARYYPSHSSESWREFWEGKVKPDYLEKVVQPKKEQASPRRGERLESGALQKVAEHPADQSDEAPSSDEEVDRGLEEVVEEGDHRKSAEEEMQLDDGLESLFCTPIPMSPKDSCPFTCRWLGCNADVPSMSMLHEHVSSKHKPGRKDVAYGRAYTCQWRGCSKVRVDEYGNEIVLDLREPEVWANHFIKEHIEAIRLRYGLGPSESEGRMVKHETPSTKHATGDAESSGSGLRTSGVATVLSRPRSPRKREKLAQVDGTSEEGEQEEEADDDESEEAEETEGASSSEELTSEIVSLNSNEDDDDRDSDTSPRRSKRLRNAPPPRMTEPTVLNYVDTAVGSSPPVLAEDTPDREIDSPSIRPLSPSPSKPPEPNEARKRSAGKGNSQESNQSLAIAQEAIDLHGGESSQHPVVVSPRKRTRELEPEPESTRQGSPDPPTRTHFEPQVKRRKQRHNQEEPLEIPSTPEHRTVLGELYQEDDDDQGSSMLGGSPTPRPRARFSTSDNTFVRTTSQRADFQAEDAQLTSPLQISMFSEPDNKFAPSSPAKSASTRQDELSSEPDLEFETAPQTNGNLWVTAPSQEPEEEDVEETQYETAPEPKDKRRERLDTQALFAQSIPDIDGEEDPFALPEPDGGWPDGMDDDDGLGGPLTELPIPTSYQPKRVDNMDDEDEDDDDAASISSDIPGWVDECTAEDDSIDQEILVCAIQATSGFNEKLIREVHDFIRARMQDRDPDILPMHIKGCWTLEDDEALKKGDARERIRILKKHGRSSVERRSAWLNVAM